MKNLWRSIQIIPEYKGRVVGIVIVGTVLGFIGTATPWLYKGIVDAISRMLSGSITHEQATWTVTSLLIGFFVLRLGVVIFSALQNKQADDLWLDTVSTFRQRVFDHLTDRK